MSRPIPFVVVARPAIAPWSAAGMSLKSRPHASVITLPPAIATTKITGRYQPVPLLAEPACEQAEPVHDRGGENHAAEPSRSPR